MARYEHLPIYRDALALAIHLEKVVAGFSRYHKYTLGTELRNSKRVTRIKVDRISLRHPGKGKTKGICILPSVIWNVGVIMVEGSFAFPPHVFCLYLMCFDGMVMIYENLLEYYCLMSSLWMVKLTIFERIGKLPICAGNGSGVKADKTLLAVLPSIK